MPTVSNLPAPDDGLGELSDMLDECELDPPTITMGEGAGLPDLDDLDSLLNESVKLRDEAREAKAAADRLKRRYASGSGRTAEEVAEDEARVREWELRHNWEATANIALWERHRCVNCGRQQTIFRQMMLKQRHRVFPDTVRWQQTDETVDGLPAENLVQKWEVGMCTNCAGEFGFGFQDVPVGEWK